VIIAISGSIYYILTKDLGWESVNYSKIATTRGAYISPLIFGILRSVYAIIIWISVVEVLIDKNGLSISIPTRNGKLKVVNIKHFARFTTFTVWSWVLQGFYFTFAAYFSLSYYFAVDRESYANLNALSIKLTWVLFEISLPISFIISAIVTFILIPGAKKNNVPVNVFYTFQALLMHNANVLFMASEMMMNALTIKYSHFPFIILYGATYAVFSWIWFNLFILYYAKISFL
jgi:hypothetical protein